MDAFIVQLALSNIISATHFKGVRSKREKTLRKSN